MKVPKVQVFNSKEDVLLFLNSLWHNNLISVTYDSSIQQYVVFYFLEVAPKHY